MLLPPILAVSLTGCSTFFGSDEPFSLANFTPDPAWTDTKTAAPLEPTVEPRLLELPPALELCLKRSLAAKKSKKVKVPVADDKTSADALVLAERKTKRDRELCAYQLLKWHQERRQKAVKK